MIVATGPLFIPDVKLDMNVLHKHSGFQCPFHNCPEDIAYKVLFAVNSP
jgi:hypothetical protein